MNGFLEVQGLLELERAEKWNEARELLYNLWYSDKNNVDKLRRVLAECWYVVTEWDFCIRNENLSFDAFEQTLIGVTQYGVMHFSADVDFLWLAGYMISLFPYHFYEGNPDGFYSKWEQKGKDMLLHATQIEPGNLISKVLYLGSQGSSEEYSTVKRQLSPILNNIFTGYTAIEEYFKDILSS